MNRLKEKPEQGNLRKFADGGGQCDAKSHLHWGYDCLIVFAAPEERHPEDIRQPQVIERWIRTLQLEHAGQPCSSRARDVGGDESSPSRCQSVRWQEKSAGPKSCAKRPE